mmetsp:Transcript_45533/g.145199  ORF Transcript_45533/g.145199 Transcript_45533/m.145199 type:complete len:81 (-) Transcript_45533:726-968(-)
MAYSGETSRNTLGAPRHQPPLGRPPLGHPVRAALQRTQGGGNGRHMMLQARSKKPMLASLHFKVSATRLPFPGSGTRAAK